MRAIARNAETEIPSVSPEGAGRPALPPRARGAVSRWQLAAAAKSCWRAAEGFSSRRALAGYLVRNLVARLGLRAAPSEELSLTRGTASTLSRLGSAPELPSGPGPAVQVVALAEVIFRNQIPVVHLLKLDVEGSELNVLEGLEPALDRVERIVMEYHSSALLERSSSLPAQHGFRKMLDVPPAYAYFLASGIEMRA